MTEVFDFRRTANEPIGKPYELTMPVFFVGFMGAGKTSVARKLARSAGVTAIDMDAYIARSCDMKVKQIFAETGEDGFRQIETDVLRELASSGEPQLISCGGGIVLAEENRRILADNGYVVHLRVTADEAASRISDISTRPLFGDLDQARHVIEARMPLYEEVADLTIDTTGRGTGSIAREVFARLKDKGILLRSDRQNSR